MIQQLIRWSLLSLFGFSYLLQAELKESFSYQERIQLLKMATFGINAELLHDVNTTNMENSSSKEIAWLDSQLNSPSAYDGSDDEWKTHLQRVVDLTIFPCQPKIFIEVGTNLNFLIDWTPIDNATLSNVRLVGQFNWKYKP